MKKKAALVELLPTINGLSLVFCETKRMADHLEEFLYNQGFAATSIHGDRSQRERENALELFKSGKVQILVATDVAARGLDVHAVKHVVNYDLPGDINDYVHRIGRTGRAGHEGVATAFFNDKNYNIARDLVDIMEESGQDVEAWLMDVANRFASRGTRPKRGARGGGAGFLGRGGNGYSSYGGARGGGFYGGGNYGSGGNYGKSDW